MPKSTILDDISTSSSAEDQDFDKMILNEPMYYILAQFFETEDHENIASVLAKILVELREIKTTLSSSQKAPSS